MGDTGANAGAYHLHFCVTTKPDRPQFKPFESVPVAFRNYSYSPASGLAWVKVATGVPRQGYWLRREASQGSGAPQVNSSASAINFRTGHAIDRRLGRLGRAPEIDDSECARECAQRSVVVHHQQRARVQ
jgi:hypothetical protein